MQQVPGPLQLLGYGLPPGLPGLPPGLSGMPGGTQPALGPPLSYALPPGMSLPAGCLHGLAFGALPGGPPPGVAPPGLLPGGLVGAPPGPPGGGPGLPPGFSWHPGASYALPPPPGTAAPRLPPGLPPPPGMTFVLPPGAAQQSGLPPPGLPGAPPAGAMAAVATGGRPAPQAAAPSPLPPPPNGLPPAGGLPLGYGSGLAPGLPGQPCLPGLMTAAAPGASGAGGPHAGPPPPPPGATLGGPQPDVAGPAALAGPAPGREGAAAASTSPPGGEPEAAGRGSSSSGGARSGAAEAAEEVPAERKKCHLHKKPNKSCKICQRVSEQVQAPERPTRAAESASQAAAAKLGAAAAAAAEARSAANKPVFNCNAMLKDQILKSSYFKSLLKINTVDALAEEIQSYADCIDIYQPGSATSPSVFLCCVFRLFTLEHSEEELQLLLDHAESVCARCVGFLYVRFAERPDRLWDALEEYVLDEMDFRSLEAKQPGLPATVGEYVESLLIKEKYFGTPLPRLPVAVRRKLEERLAPLPQYRKRAQANRRALRQFREKGTPVEVCQDGQWLRGTVLELEGAVPSRLKLGVRLDHQGRGEVVAHLGKVILRDPGAPTGSDSDTQRDRRRGRGASRSRSRRGRRQVSPDWSRHKGKSDARMVKELREQAREDAVCASGKEYAKRPMGFEAGLAVRREQGSAETQLIQEDTFASAERRQRRRPTQEEEEERDRAQNRRSDEEQERQRKLMQIYEKYGQQAGGAGGAHGRSGDVEGPDVMRLG